VCARAMETAARQAMDRSSPGPVGPAEVARDSRLSSSPTGPRRSPLSGSPAPTPFDSSSHSPPISVSSSPDISICWRVSAQDHDAHPPASELLRQIEALTRQLSSEGKLRRQAEETLATVADKGVHAHLKGLEQTLSRRNKKIRALEAINESLRHQIAKHKSIPKMPADEIVTGKVSGAEDHPHTRTWSRVSSVGALSPCWKAGADNALRAAQAWRAPISDGDNPSAPCNDSMNDRSISFIAEVSLSCFTKVLSHCSIDAAIILTTGTVSGERGH